MFDCNVPEHTLSSVTSDKDCERVITSLVINPIEYGGYTDGIKSPSRTWVTAYWSLVTGH